MNHELEHLRQQIDILDQKIQELISERAQLALKIATIKKSENHQPSFYRPEREAQILESVIERNHGPLDNDVITKIFQDIMSACRTLQIHHHEKDA